MYGFLWWYEPDLLPVSCMLTVFCKSVSPVQISKKFKKNRKPCRCPVCTQVVSTRNSIESCSSVVEGVFQTQDDDVHMESRVYDFYQLETSSRSRFSLLIFFPIVESIFTLRRLPSKIEITKWQKLGPRSRSMHFLGTCEKTLRNVKFRFFLRAKHFFFCKSTLRSGSFFASTHKVHRPRSRSPLHFDIRNIQQIRSEK